MPAKLLRHRRGRLRHRVLPLAAVVIAAVVPSAPAAAQAPALTVVGDSVIVASPPIGRLTIRVTRPDAVTGNPVVIGLYAGRADSSLPFTVNTTAPTALQPNGDCWQSGALSQALTPDIRPGDTVTVATDPGPFGSGMPPMSVTVPANGSGGNAGPIPECRSVAPFAQNAATAAPESATGGPINVSGVSQPLASAVSVAVSDETRATTPVDVTPNADGTWSSAIPADQVDRLANGSLTVQPIFAVPDVSTGAPAHIRGAPISTRRSGGGQAGSDTAAGPASQPGSGRGPAQSSAMRVSKLVARSPVSLARARREGVSASCLVPRSARVIDIRLMLGRRVLVQQRDYAWDAGARQIVRLGGKALDRVLHRGRYTLAVRAGSSPRALGPPVLTTLRVR